MGLEEGLAADVAEEERLPVATVSSTIVFHSPQAGHFPIHLGLSFPQEVQNQAVFILFAIVLDIQKKDIVPVCGQYLPSVSALCLE